MERRSVVTFLLSAFLLCALLPCVQGDGCTSWCKQHPVSRGGDAGKQLTFSPRKRGGCQNMNTKDPKDLGQAQRAFSDCVRGYTTMRPLTSVIVMLKLLTAMAECVFFKVSSNPTWLSDRFFSIKSYSKSNEDPRWPLMSRFFLYWLGGRDPAAILGKI